MEKEKNNTFIMIILIIVVIIMAITIGYLLGSKNSNSSSNSNNETVNTESNEQVEEDDIVEETSYTPMCSNYDTSITLKTNINSSNYTNIFNYISKQKDITMTVTYPTNEIETSDEYSTVYKQASYNLTSDEIEEVLSELKGVKTILASGGAGGAVNRTTLKIEYIRNGQKYYFEFKDFPGAIASNDGNIYNLLDNTSTKEYENNYCVYTLLSYSEVVSAIVESKK